MERAAVRLDDLAGDVDESRAALAGCVRAGRLCDQLVAMPSSWSSRAVVGHGGTGKSAVLATAAAILNAAGLEVLREPPSGPVSPDAVLLIDDAHRLDPRTLDRLTELARRPDGPAMLVAYRPWPLSTALAGLGAVLSRANPPLVLARLDRASVAVRATARLNTVPPSALIDLITEQTGGLPLLVDRVLACLRPGRSGRPELLTDAVVEQFRHDLDLMDPPAREVLTALAAGAVAHTPAWDAAFDDPHDAWESAVATGLISTDGAMIPLATAAIRALTPTGRLDEMARRLGGASESDEASRAVDAALSGELDLAIRLADHVLTGPTGPGTRDAVAVTCAVLTARGMMASGAELHRRMGLGVAAVPALMGVGALEEATACLSGTGTDQGRTLSSAAEALMARGLLGTINGHATAALSDLSRAAAMLEPVGHQSVLTDSPAGLAAVVAIHSGELGIAESVLDRAITAGLGGALTARRHHLLRAFVDMLRGHVSEVTHRLACLGDAPLEPRDELLRVAVEAGTANRQGDLAALRNTWSRAREAMVRHPVDLYCLLPVGELAVGAARLRESRWMAPILIEADLLLDRMGRPALWTAPMEWLRVRTAIAAEEPQEARQRVRALMRLGGKDTAAGVLATAARCWLTVLAGEVDPEAVERAALDLAGVGLAWDAAKLAGQAAIRVDDRGAMSRLLNCARTLHANPAPSASRGGPDAERPMGRDSEVTLSDRELEVAELVVGGLTYRQIGERLFISAKTVEHHVARMRQRLGCTSRDELFSLLRARLTTR